jgi:hypothetical protein
MLDQKTIYKLATFTLHGVTPKASQNYTQISAVDSRQNSVHNAAWPDQHSEATWHEPRPPGTPPIAALTRHQRTRGWRVHRAARGRDAAQIWPQWHLKG